MKLKRFKRQATKFIVPGFLSFAIICGGASHSGQTIHLWIQLTAIIAMITLLPQAIQSRWSIRLAAFTLLGFALIGWSLIQLVPLPEELWNSLGDRRIVSDGFDLIGLSPTPDLPISLVPESTYTALLGFLPPFAAIIMVTAMGWRRAIESLRWVIPCLGALSVVIGLAQVFLGPDSWLYFYAFTNRGSPVGVFSNANHQATLLLMCLPFIAALAGSQRQSWRSGDEALGKAVATGVLFLLIIIGILAAGSFAGYALLLPVLLLSLLLLRSGRHSSGGKFSISIVLLAVVLSATLVGFSPRLDGLGMTSFDDGELSRKGIWRVTDKIIDDHAVAGTGLGTFPDVYRLYENPEKVTQKYVNNAHNDYLQIIVEWGYPGIAIVGLALILWLWVFIRGWTKREDQAYRLRRAASISLFVVIMHSLVDYPIRTPAIAVLCAICLSIMLIPHRSTKPKSGNTPDQEDKASKHLTL